MNNRLQIFNFEEHKVRSVSKDGEPWFVLKDVCDVLDLSNSRRVAERLDDDEKQKAERNFELHSRSNEPITIINEPGLYKVILRSDKPNAKKFMRWVTHDVLPAIREKGYYATPNLLPTQLFLDFQNQDKIAFADAVLASKDSIPLGTYARFLRTRGVDIGRKRIFQTLRDYGFLVKSPNSERNNPTQTSLERGLLELVKKVGYDDSGKLHTTIATYVTNKGQLFFMMFFKNIHLVFDVKKKNVLAN